MSDFGYKETDLNSIRFYNSVNLPPKVVCNIKTPSKTQVFPNVATCPQDVLDANGMYRDNSAYSKNPKAFYADLSSLGDYESNLKVVRDIQEKFQKLSPEIRGRFDNSPSAFVKYCCSKDFDMKNVLTEQEYKAVMAYKKEEDSKKAYEAYLKSPEYKAEQQEIANRRAYEQAKYEEWKLNNIKK